MWPRPIAVRLLPIFASASGGGYIQATHDLVQVTLEAPRKTPMRGHERAWAQQVEEWNKANPAVADRAVVEIETSVLPRYRTKPSLLPKSFAASS